MKVSSVGAATPFMANAKSQTTTNPVNTPAYKVNTDRLRDSFVRMAKVDTGSCEATKVPGRPSTDKQIPFAKMLANDLKEMGLADVKLDEHGVVTATMKGNIDNSPVVGLIAHIDTSEQAPTGPVKPMIHDYKGGNIKLKDGVEIQEKDLKPYKNNVIITSDGTSLLGADDKAGIAEIMEALKVFSENPDLKRPTLRIAFTPDEETGHGADDLDVKTFGADLAYTVDGSEADLIETETFNAYNPEITIEGVQVHPGYAYKKMVNSIEVAKAIMNKLPEDETPATTKDREGYFHVHEIAGGAEKVTMKMLIRDFDDDSAKNRLEFLQNAIKEVEEQYPGCKISMNPKKRYSNMKEGLKKLPEVVEFAKEGLKRTGINPVETVCRGGTDGAALTLRGLPTPNLGTGGINYHSVREFVSLETMKQCTENVINTVMTWAERANEVMPKIMEIRNERNQADKNS